MTLSKETQYKVQISKRTYKTPLETVFMKILKQIDRSLTETKEADHYQLHIWSYSNMALRRKLNDERVKPKICNS